MSELVFSDLSVYRTSIVCRHVLTGARIVRYAEVDFDGFIAASCGEADHEGKQDWAVVGFGHVLDGSNDLAKLGSLQFGECAELGKDGEWTREVLVENRE